MQPEENTALTTEEEEETSSNIESVKVDCVRQQQIVFVDNEIPINVWTSPNNTPASSSHHNQDKKSIEGYNPYGISKTNKAVPPSSKIIFKSQSNLDLERTSNSRNTI